MFFERPDAGETAVLVHVDFHDEQKREDPGEFLELVRSAGAEPATLLTASRHRPDSRTFIGSGKLEELRALLAAHEAELVIFNHSLSPSQERNVEQELKCRVLDRTGLILDIFAQRARTHEGKLQVELAQLEYMSTRLVRGWTHLERQKAVLACVARVKLSLKLTDAFCVVGLNRFINGLIRFVVSAIRIAVPVLALKSTASR